MGRRNAVAVARRGSSRSGITAAVVTVVVLAVVVVAGVIWSGRSSQQAGAAAAAPIPVTRVAASYPVALRAGTIELGRPTARRTVEVYEDALCPACKQFETDSGPRMTAALQAGKIKVRYHLVNLLESRSNPPGYSTLGGNAMMCAAENGAFPSVHTSLYNAQPEESGVGYTNAQLVALGQSAGAGPGYADCVNQTRHGGEIAATFKRASTDPKLLDNSEGQSSFGTPTIVLDGKKVDSDALAPVLG